MAQVSKNARHRNVLFPEKLLTRLEKIHKAYASQWRENEGVICPKSRTWSMVVELGCIAAEQQLGLKHQ